jgi:hypothetical protein
MEEARRFKLSARFCFSLLTGDDFDWKKKTISGLLHEPCTDNG